MYIHITNARISLAKIETKNDSHYLPRRVSKVISKILVVAQIVGKVPLDEISDQCTAAFLC